MTLALYFDHHVPGPVASGLRRLGIDVLTVEQDGLGEATDEVLLERATALGRVMVTSDRDYLRIAAHWLAERRFFTGVVHLRSQLTPYGAVIENLQVLAEVYDAADMVNRVEYLP